MDSANRVGSIDPRSSIAIGGVVSNSDGLSIATDGNTTSNSRGSMGAIVSAISSIASIAKAIGTIVGISISRPLGSVDSANRVSSINSRSSISIGGIVSNSHGLSIATDSNTTSNSRSSMGAIVSAISSISSIAETIGTIVSISISRPLGSVDSTNRVSSIDSRSSIAIGGIVRNSHRLSIATDSNTTSNSGGSMGAIVSTISSIAK